MTHADQLRARADRCRRLALGLTDRRDISALEELAADYEARARALSRPDTSSGRVIAA